MVLINLKLKVIECQTKLIIQFISNQQKTSLIQNRLQTCFSNYSINYMQNKYNINHTNQKFVEFCSSCK